MNVNSSNSTIPSVVYDAFDQAYDIERIAYQLMSIGYCDDKTIGYLLDHLSDNSVPLPSIEDLEALVTSIAANGRTENVFRRLNTR